MDFRTNKKTGKKYPITDFRHKLDKFQIGSSSKVTGYPREEIVRKSGFYSNGNISEKAKKRIFYNTYNADVNESELHSLIKGNIMDYYTEDNTATGIANRKDMREFAFNAYNNSLRSKGKPEVTKEKFEEELEKGWSKEGYKSKTNKEKKEGLQFISAKGIRPPKPTTLDRIRTIEAENGFNGIIKKETTFKVAEHNKPEFVSVIPLLPKS